MYKTSFCSLEIIVEGVYSAYNLTENEIEDLIKTFGKRNINGSGGNYTIFKNADRKVILKLFVHGLWRPMTFDIRQTLLDLYDSDKLYKRNVEYLSKRLKEERIQLHVEYSRQTGVWYISDFDKLIEVLRDLIDEQKEDAG